MAAEQTRPVTGSGLGPAYAAVRARLALVLALFGLAAVGWWWTVGQMQGMDEGPWTAVSTSAWPPKNPDLSDRAAIVVLFVPGLAPGQLHTGGTGGLGMAVSGRNPVADWCVRGSYFEA
jgi:hypothetical protein